MKQIIKNYTFNKTAKTVTLTDFSAIALDRLLLITNVTANKVVYQFNNPQYGGSVSGNILTLLYDTSAMANTDKLQIIYDCAAGDPVYDSAATVGGVYNTAGVTLANGQRSDLQLDSHGYLITTLGTTLVAEDTTTNAFRVEGTYQETAGLSAGALNADLVPSTETSLFKWLSLQITGTWAGTLTFQGSNDNSNWNNVVLQRASDNLTGTATTTTSNAIYHGPVFYRYLRVRMTSYTSGTATGTLQLYTLPATLTNYQVSAAQLGSWSVGASTAIGAAVPANAFYLGIQAASGNLSGAKAFDAGDGVSGATMIATGGYAWDGAVANRLRTPAIFKTAVATTAGDTALWTPATGKRFRLMRYQIQVTAAAAQASAGSLDIVLRDGTTALPAAYSVFVPNTAATTFADSANSGWVDLGNGIISAAANNVLNINLSATLTSGKVRVVMAGTEE